MSSKKITKLDLMLSVNWLLKVLIICIERILNLSILIKRIFQAIKKVLLGDQKNTSYLGNRSNFYSKRSKIATRGIQKSSLAVLTIF
ncbi:hypothetical protein DGG96_16700 [Legionella qingyii]|uniref:Uncharacterized protein n=1 Tax=Legionella qingyii TaxID=2184757 RepID=A0A317TZZ0_9GAMM|nr:hypothetical protein DGG96_16700 [Legionella qingyii]